MGKRNGTPVAGGAKKPDESAGLPDYDKCEMTGRERIVCIITGCAAIYAAGFIFYRSHAFSALLCPLGFFYPYFKAKRIIEKRKENLNIQFKDMLYSLSSSLSAGKPVELALPCVLKDLAVLYPDPDTDIIMEVLYIIRKTEFNEPVESAFSDFARRARLEDIENFADVLRICKRTGGNIVEVIKNTSNIISDKVEIKQEIKVMLSERKFEQKVLNALPVLMVMLLSASAGNYMEPVFTTLPGRVVMTVSITLFASAYFISRKIMSIRV